MRNKPLLVFLARVVHEKTKSDQHMIGFFQDFFNLIILRREAYSDKELIKEIKKHNPYGVVFHALPPSVSKHLKHLKSMRLIWIPMWDGFRNLSLKKRFLFRYYGLKVTVTSEILYTYFKSIKIDVKLFKYALKPNFHIKNFKVKPPYTIFLWQRCKEIGVQEVVNLIGKENIEKIIYKSNGDYPVECDSIVEKLPPWSSKEEYLKKVKEVDYYVAPRFAEGIGFSFLEPFFMGVPIIGYDEATMNEYIIDGSTGHLFGSDLTLYKKPVPPKTLYPKIKKQCELLYEDWLNQKGKLLDFIVG